MYFVYLCVASNLRNEQMSQVTSTIKSGFQKEIYGAYPQSEAKLLQATCIIVTVYVVVLHVFVVVVTE